LIKDISHNNRILQRVVLDRKPYMVGLRKGSRMKISVAGRDSQPEQEHWMGVWEISEPVFALRGQEMRE
jgi:hypothetical protein